MKLHFAKGGGSSGLGYGLLTVMLAAGLGYVFWQTGQPANPTTANPAAPPPVRANPSGTVVINTNLITRTVPVRTNAPRVTPLVGTSGPVIGQPPVVAPPTNRPATPELGTLRGPRNPLEAQIALARNLICPGAVDGAMGSQTRAALRVFQRRENLPVTGELNEGTKARLTLQMPVFGFHTVTTGDVARLQPVATTWLGKSQQSALDFETVLEEIAERYHAHTALLKQLNPNIMWGNVLPGQTLEVPLIEYPPPTVRAASVHIRLAEKCLQAYDSRGTLLVHFPCSIAARVEKRPVGELHVIAVARNPNYTFDPEVFPESAEARELGRKLIIPPGPNNPVGLAWIGLDRPGYGIHGTPRPEDVGRTESHGCFRLANWNAEHLVRIVSPGTSVFVDP
jgi:lipoprotein-anchoring transpeptidase ErfK/SrfK